MSNMILLLLSTIAVAALVYKAVGTVTSPDTENKPPKKKDPVSKVTDTDVEEAYQNGLSVGMDIAENLITRIKQYNPVITSIKEVDVILKDAQRIVDDSVKLADSNPSDRDIQINLVNNKLLLELVKKQAHIQFVYESKGEYLY